VPARSHGPTLPTRAAVLSSRVAGQRRPWAPRGAQAAGGSLAAPVAGGAGLWSEAWPPGLCSPGGRILAAELLMLRGLRGLRGPVADVPAGAGTRRRQLLLLVPVWRGLIFCVQVCFMTSSAPWSALFDSYGFMYGGCFVAIGAWWMLCHLCFVSCLRRILIRRVLPL